MIREFRTDTSGQAVIMGALLVPVLIGMGALAIDTSSFYSDKNRLQSAADAGALSAALALKDRTVASAKALEFARINVPAGFGSVITDTDIVFGTYDKNTQTFTPAPSPTSPINAVQVTAGRTAARGNASPTFLGGIFGKASADIAAQSIAVGLTPGACVYALHPSSSSALQVGGSATLSVPNCGIQVNSSSSSGASTTGSGTVTALNTNVVGQYTGNQWTPLPKTGQLALPDPLASLPEPAQPGACYMTDISTSGDITLPSNKTYCGALHVSGSGKITLQKGLYYFKNADIKISQSAALVGDEVLWFLDATSQLDISSTGTINLWAQRTGPYAGVVIFQSRSASNIQNKITGNPTFTIDGTLYMPKSELVLSGSSGAKSKAGYLIVESIKLSGSSEFVLDTYSGILPASLSNGAVLVN